jgi:anti-sigma regulatory factor (Ser/Thr protein kinase)
MATDTLTLTAENAEAVSDARRVLSGRLNRWRCSRTQDTLVVFSELVTNAVKDAGAATRIVITHRDDTLRFEVHDSAHAGPCSP